MKKSKKSKKEENRETVDPTGVVVAGSSSTTTPSAATANKAPPTLPSNLYYIDVSVDDNPLDFLYKSDDLLDSIRKNKQPQQSQTQQQASSARKSVVTPTATTATTATSSSAVPIGPNPLQDLIEDSLLQCIRQQDPTTTTANTDAITGASGTDAVSTTSNTNNTTSVGAATGVHATPIGINPLQDILEETGDTLLQCIRLEHSVLANATASSTGEGLATTTAAATADPPKWYETIETLRKQYAHDPITLEKQLKRLRKNKEFSKHTYCRRFQEIEPFLQEIVKTLQRKPEYVDKNKFYFADSIVAMKKILDRIYEYLEQILVLRGNDESDESESEKRERLSEAKQQAIDKAICDNLRDFITILPSWNHGLRWKQHILEKEKEILLKAAAIVAPVAPSPLPVVAAASPATGTSSSNAGGKKAKSTTGVTSSSAVSAAAVVAASQLQQLLQQKQEESKEMAMTDHRKTTFTTDEAHFLLNTLCKAIFFHVTKPALTIQFKSDKVKGTNKRKRKRRRRRSQTTGEEGEGDGGKEDDGDDEESSSSEDEVDEKAIEEIKKVLTYHAVERRLGLSRRRIAKNIDFEYDSKKNQRQGATDGNATEGGEEGSEEERNLPPGTMQVHGGSSNGSGAMNRHETAVDLDEKQLLANFFGR